MTIQKFALYTGVMLTESSQKALRLWWLETVGILEKDIYCHHMTIAFKPSLEELSTTPVGDQFRLKVIGFVNKEGVQAVVVDDNGISANKFPHLTVATDGTPPFQSNKRLETYGYEKVHGPTLTGRIGYWDGKTEVYTNSIISNIL